MPFSGMRAAGLCSMRGRGLWSQLISANPIGELVRLALARTSASSSLNLNSASGDRTDVTMLVDMLSWRGATTVSASRWAWTVLMTGMPHGSSSGPSPSWGPGTEGAGDGSGAGLGTWRAPGLPAVLVVTMRGGPR